jgi:hypothetical protein
LKWRLIKARPLSSAALHRANVRKAQPVWQIGGDLAALHGKTGPGIPPESALNPKKKAVSMARIGWKRL